MIFLDALKCLMKYKIDVFSRVGSPSDPVGTSRIQSLTPRDPQAEGSDRWETNIWLLSQQPTAETMIGSHSRAAINVLIYSGSARLYFIF